MVTGDICPNNRQISRNIQQTRPESGKTSKSLPVAVPNLRADIPGSCETPTAYINFSCLRALFSE